MGELSSISSRNNVSSAFTQSSAATLPPELLLAILAHAIPIYDRPPDWTGKVESTMDKYVSERHVFAQLASVCRRWYPIIQSFLFNPLVIVRPSKSVSLPAALMHHGSNVRTIVVDASSDALSYEDDFLLSINRSFALATQLKAIEIYGPHKLFDRCTTRYVPEVIAPLSVRKLRWQCETSSHSGKNQEQLCDAIIRLSNSLEHLEIEGCYDLTLCDTPRLPAALPRLSHLGLILGNPKLPHLLGLLDCATVTSHNVTSSTLRELDLRSVLTLGADEITAILQRNDMGLHLKSLSISLWRGFRSHPNIYDFPCTILALCSSLTHFSYLTSCTPKLFAYLPETLQSLELGTLSPGMPPSPIFPPAALLEYLGSTRASNLRILTLVRRNAIGGGIWDERVWEKMVASVKEKCRECSVDVVWEVQT